MAKKGGAKTGGRRKGTPNKATEDIKSFARRILEDPTYRLRVLTDARAGTLHSTIEARLYDYAYGRPKETVSLEASDSLAAVLERTVRRG